MTRALISTLLALAGLLLLFLGGSILLSPQAFFATNHIVLGEDPSLLSEVRAPAGLLVLSGALIGLGAFRRSWTTSALVLTAAVYGSYGASRLVGVALSGMPGEGLMAAMAIELVVAVLAASTLLAGRGATVAELKARTASPPR